MERKSRMTRKDFFKILGLLGAASVATACASQWERKNDQIVREFLRKAVKTSDLESGSVDFLPDSLRERFDWVGVDIHRRPKNLASVGYNFESGGRVKNFANNFALGESAFFTELTKEAGSFAKKIGIFFSEGTIPNYEQVLPSLLSASTDIQGFSRKENNLSPVFQDPGMEEKLKRSIGGYFLPENVFQSGFAVYFTSRDGNEKYTWQVLNNAVARTISYFALNGTFGWQDFSAPDHFIDFVIRWMKLGNISPRGLGELYQRSNLEGFLRPTLDSLVKYKERWGGRNLFSSEIGFAFWAIDANWIPVFAIEVDERIERGIPLSQARSEAFQMVIDQMLDIGIPNIEENNTPKDGNADSLERLVEANSYYYKKRQVKEA